VRLVDDGRSDGRLVGRLCLCLLVRPTGPDDDDDDGDDDDDASAAFGGGGAAMAAASVDAREVEGGQHGVRISLPEWAVP
jgi:hypothetical protein